VPGPTPHGLRHGHQTAMRRDRVPSVLRRDQLGHGPSDDIADHYIHVDSEMIGDMLAGQTQRWHAAVIRRARTDGTAGPSRIMPLARRSDQGRWRHLAA
jgi:hypothetical protein